MTASIRCSHIRRQAPTRSANLISAINSAHTGNSLDVSAALSGGSTGNLVLTGTNGIASITVGGTATADTAIGFGAGANSFQPTNLLTQGAVAPGDTMTISVNGTPTTITFGTTGGRRRHSRAIANRDRRHQRLDRNGEHRQRQHLADVQ